MFYYKKDNNLYALKAEPRKIIEVEENGDKAKKCVIDDSLIAITKEEFERMRKAKLPKINKK